MQTVLEGHDTASKVLPCAPLGLGLGWTDQPLPFQRSASVTDTWALLT